MGTDNIIGKGAKITINGEEFSLENDVNFKCKYEKTNIRDMKTSCEVEIKFTWWEMLKLRLWLFKIKYFSKVYAYTIKIEGKNTDHVS